MSTSSRSVFIVSHSQQATTTTATNHAPQEEPATEDNNDDNTDLNRSTTDNKKKVEHLSHTQRMCAVSVLLGMALVADRQWDDPAKHNTTTHGGLPSHSCFRMVKNIILS